MKKRKIKVSARAKINLSLNVSGKGNRGLHLLDSVTASVSLADVVTVCERFDEKVRVTYNGEDSRYENDSVLKAIRSLWARFGVFGLDVTVEKRLPEGAGVGGSSADAAAVIYACNELFGFYERGYTSEDAEKVGSDVPVMSVGGYARVTGTGAKFETFEGKKLDFVLVSGGKGISTPECFRVFDELYPSARYEPTDNDALVAAIKDGNLSRIASLCGNALTRPASKCDDIIERRISALWEAGALAAFMTGSGSGCIGLFRDEQQAWQAEKELYKCSELGTPIALTTMEKGMEPITSRRKKTYDFRHFYLN